MNPVNFKLTESGARHPLALAGGWLLYPCFKENHLLIHPGAAVSVSCGTELVCADNLVMTLNTCPQTNSPLIIHPSVISNGETAVVRLTNASSAVCVIAKDSFDYAAKRGHGIYRAAVIIPYDKPVAFGIPVQSVCSAHEFAEAGAEGMCNL